MMLFPSHIILNGQRFSTDQLIRERMEKTGWEREWLDFLAEWYGPAPSVSVNTSGSTGTPKTISLSKEFVAASAQRTLQYFNLKENDRVLHCLPSGYIAGKLMVVRTLLGKLDMHVIDPSSGFDILTGLSFRFAAMVPNQACKILDHENGSARLQQIQQLLIGGGPVPASLYERLQPLSTACFSSYAMTETATHIAIRKLNGHDAGEFYLCMDGIRLSLSPKGCLRVHMAGLAQEAPYLQTTDLAELIDEKTFRIIGRADHVIISGGMKFHPEQLERKLENEILHPFMISSLPDDKLGEQIILIVEADEDPAVAEALQEVCRRCLSRYEQPRQIRFTRQLPRTPNGKLKRGQRRE